MQHDAQAVCRALLVYLCVCVRTGGQQEAQGEVTEEEDDEDEEENEDADDVEAAACWRGNPLCVDSMRFPTLCVPS